jgi:hypothetical protein
VLKEFLACGKTVVWCKQIGTGNNLLPAAGLMEVAEIGHGYRPDLVCTLVRANHPIAEGVPWNFTMATSLSYYDSDDPGVKTIVQCPLGDIVLSKNVERGRVILIGSDYSLYTQPSARLLANCLRMVSDERRPRFVRGDVNADGTINIADAIQSINFLFGGGAVPTCLDAADVNNDARLGDPHPIDLADAIFLLQFLFGNGTPPPEPFGSFPPRFPLDCGVDPEVDDGIDCDAYSPCD